jgi:hypothetical protein
MSEKVVNIESKNVLARLMATENIHVEHKKVATASFDVKNRRLVLPLWKDMTNTMYEGLIGHEVGHALYTPHKEWVTFAKNNEHLKDYANILEDARIERKMKIKYPGMKKTFFSMYDALSQRDFFGTKNRELEDYGFADRLNLHFKLGVLANVPFSAEEKKFADRVLKAETFKDILALTKELGEIAEKEAETNMDDMGFSLDDLDPDSIEENDGESDFDMPSPPPPAPSNDDQENQEDSDESAEEDDEKSEEKSTGFSRKPADEEKSEEKELDSKDLDADKNAEGADGTTAPDFKPAPPKPETQSAWDRAMEEMNDEEAKEPVYLDLPKTNYKDAIVPWKETFEELNNHWNIPESFTGYRWDTNDSSDPQWKKKSEDEFRAWKKDTAQIVNYMVKEFEMKQAATAYRRTSVAKSGVLDMNKLHKYKTDEDIFKRVASVKDGRNHALMMFVDWSGSMSGKMEATVKQTLTLVMFARKVGIPYRVYSFSNSGDLCNKLKPFYTKSENHTDHLMISSLGMHEYFNEKMSGREFNAQLKNLAFLGKSLDYSGLVAPEGHGMSSTPLNEAIIASYDMIGDFKKETGKEKINAIFLTDGGADSCRAYWDSTAGEDGNGEEKHIYGYSSRDNKYMVIRDATTKRIIHGHQSRGAGLTSSLLTNLGKRHKINVIGFHITDRRMINQQIHYSLGYEKGDDLKRFCTKNGYAPITNAGYDTYFLVNDKSLDKEAIFEDADRDANGTIAKGKLRTQFRKFTSARKVNKMMLNEFVTLVA